MELFESRRTKFLRAFFLLFPALLLVLSCTLFVAGVSSTSDQAVHKEQDALEQALKNGAIRTYALTGTYPESLSQLLSDYHITYDKTKFVVEYVPNGSNLLPSISVIALSSLWRLFIQRSFCSRNASSNTANSSSMGDISISPENSAMACASASPRSV